MAILKRKDNKDVQKLEPSCIYRWWECKTVQTFWERAWQFFKWLNTELSYDPAIPLLGVYSKETKTHVHTKSGTWMFVSAIFISAQSRNNPNVHQLMNRYKKCDRAIQSTISHKKDWSTDTYDKMGELWKHDAMWKKPVTQGHILYNSFYTKCLG